MELNKKKFKKKEVELIIEKIKAHYNDKLNECYNVINELKEDNKKLSFEVAEFKKNEEIMLNSIKEVAKKTKDADALSEKKYNAEIVALKNFHQAWSNYFIGIFEKYPLYPSVKMLKKTVEDINIILDEDTDSKKKVQKIEKIIPKQNKNAPFDPMKKIEDYVAATSDNGFDINEVLNPGDLKLEDLCKELGLIE